MTRIGVMKHLKPLEDAGLIVTRRRGREKLPLPQPDPDPAPARPLDRQVHRTVGRRAHRPQTTDWRTHGEGLRDLHPHDSGAALGRDNRLPTTRTKFQFGARGSPPTGRRARPYEVTGPAAGPWLLEGENLEVDPPRRLVRQSARRLWGDDVKAEGRLDGHLGDRTGAATRAGCTVTHSDLNENANEQIYGGWPMILSGLKTWIETETRAHDSGFVDVRLPPFHIIIIMKC